MLDKKIFLSIGKYTYCGGGFISINMYRFPVEHTGALITCHQANTQYGRVTIVYAGAAS